MIHTVSTTQYQSHLEHLAMMRRMTPLVSRETASSPIASHRDGLTELDVRAVMAGMIDYDELAALPYVVTKPNCFIKVDDIIKLVARRLRLPVYRIKGEGHHRALVRARFAISHISYNVFQFALQKIGAALGGRHHTTVIYHVRMANKLMERKEDEFAALIADLEGSLGPAGVAG